MLVLLAPFLATAQGEADSIIMEKFVRVYFQEKIIHQELLGDFEQKVESLGIDPELYREYRERKNKDLPLDQKLSSLEIEIQAMQSGFQNQKNAAVETLCRDAQMDHSLYLSLKKRYLSEIKFNKACQKYVNAFLNTEKNE